MTEVEAAQTEAPVVVKQEVEVDLAAQQGRKLFIGNLSFKTTSDELKAFFEGMGQIEESTIITRGTRSMGYGFITFATAEEATKAAAELNKAELSERQINIEVAKPKVDRSGERRAPRRGGRRGNTARAPRPRRDPPSGQPSEKMLFCANLPFSLDDAGLCDMFKDFSISHAHVVKRKNGSSKGFGFVELTSNEEQQRALAALDNADCHGREISLKVALNDQVPPERRADAEPAAEAQE